MDQTATRSYPCLVLLAAAALVGFLAITLGWPILPGGILAYLVLTLVPGAILYLALNDNPGVLETILAATVISPVLTAAAGTILMLAGIGPAGSAAVTVALTGAAGLAVCYFARRPSWRWELERPHAALLLGSLLFLCLVIGVIAFTKDWWRLRADAWFHGAVVYQILDYGIPPEDPYVVGLPLQYMWFYHVFVAILTEASGIGPFMVMALLNIHALVAYGLAAFLLSSVIKKRFEYNFAAFLTSILGMNALFWLFYPIRLLRTFTGNVRGGEEAARLLDLTPFGLRTARPFVKVFYNQEFLLDKFMVATAFSLGVALMAFLWYAAARYLTTGKRYALWLVLVGAFGVVAYHPAIGTLMFGGLAGGLCLLFVLKRRVDGLDRGRILRMLGMLAAAGVLVVPYLYSVVHAKSGGEGIPLGFSGTKMLGIFVSCALVLLLSAFQAARLWRSREAAVWLLWCTTAAVLGVCAVVNLPAANSYDKLPFLVFFPLAIAGGWTIADWSPRRSGGAPRAWLRFSLIAFVAFAPLNVFMIAAYYHTAPILRIDEDEKQIAAWVRQNTPRDAIFFDDNNRGFLLVAGPRRYYIGSDKYAKIWGYNDATVDRRLHVRDNLYSSTEPDLATLETLGSIPSDVYVIVRSTEPTATISKFEDLPELFEKMTTRDGITVYKVNRTACRDIADALGGPE